MWLYSDSFYQIRDEIGRRSANRRGCGPRGRGRFSSYRMRWDATGLRTGVTSDFGGDKDGGVGGFGEYRSRGVIEARCAWGLIDWAALGWVGAASCRRRPGRKSGQRAVESRKRGGKRRGNLERSTLQLTPSETSRAGLHRDERDRRGGGKKVGSNNGNGMGRGMGEEREARIETISRGFSSTRIVVGGGDGGGWETKPNRRWLLLPSGSAAHRT